MPDSDLVQSSPGQGLLCLSCCVPFRAGADCPRCGSTRVVEHPELFQLSIAHMDCDSFYASVEKRDRPDLADKPLLVGSPSGRGVVTTACYISRQYGPRSAMPMFKALELCPHAVVIPPDMAKYKAVSAQIRALMLQASPVIEPLSLDEAYLDLSDGVRLIEARNPAVILARLARAVEREVGITISVGLSYNKFLAKLASDRQKPRGFSVIGRAEALHQLAPMPVSKLFGVGQATAARMKDLGLETVADLHGLTESQLVQHFGKFGRALFAMSRGNDNRAITPDRPVKSISNETTFARDKSKFDDLAEPLRALCAKVSGRLQKAELKGKTLSIKLKTSDFKVLTRAHSLGGPSNDVRLMERLALELLAREVDGRSFRLIGVGISDISQVDQAIVSDLFAGV